MATLVFTAIGTALGGPLGGALGSLLGNRIDRAVAGSPSREGPRLKELAVTTSSYGTAIPQIHGRMRVPGTIIWATDLVERKEKSGGGKGSPSVTTYSYSANFAVALASRPIESIGRIWADGNLLRGAAGDLKVGGALRVYEGHADQVPDSLIASDRGAFCPAFRGTAYCVFEALDLADFGNRIPALSFEVIGSDGEPSLVDLIASPGIAKAGDAPLPGLQGFANDGGPMSAVLNTLAQIYPISCDTGGDGLSVEPAAAALDEPILLGEPTMASEDAEAFAPQSGTLRRQQADARTIPQALRYYDIARDYQIGVQSADGRARPGRSRTLDFPGSLQAATARSLASDAAERAAWARDIVSWRTGELSPDVRPGSVVRLPGRPGQWRVLQWEWRETGVELSLERVVRASSPAVPTDSGQSVAQPDLPVPPSLLDAFELPFDGNGDPHVRHVYAAASSAAQGWRGAMLYRVENGELVEVQPTGKARAVIGALATPLAPSPAQLLERQASMDVELAAGDFALESADLSGLLAGSNLALVGGEVLQFANAERVGEATWRLTGLLRGRGGTEAAALLGHEAGTPFALIDAALDQLDPTRLGAIDGREIAALGLGDEAAVTATLRNEGLSLRPLAPVHARSRADADDALILAWTRRARGAFGWPEGVDVPIIEDSEAYRVGLGPVDAPLAAWETTAPRLTIDPGGLADLQSAHAGQPIWVRQLGRHGASDPLLLTTLP